MHECTTTCASARPSESFFSCHAGLRPMRNSLQNELWVRSPRTDKVICIGDGWFAELRQRAPRLLARVAKARSEGRDTVMLTRSDFAALVEVQKVIDDRCAPRPRDLNTVTVRIYGRRPWRRAW